MKRSLYVHRQLLNANQVQAWMRSVGFKSALPAPEMHTTIMYSKAPIEWNDVPIDPLPYTNYTDTDRAIEQFGDATVLRFDCNQLQSRWRQYMDAGASYDFPALKPHVTLTYKGGEPLTNLYPYTGPLEFGPEEYEEITASGFDPDNLTEVVLKAEKFSKSEVDYSEGRPTSHCGRYQNWPSTGECIHFRNPYGSGACALVKGEIDPSYWCKKWSRDISAVSKLDGVGGILPSGDELQEHGESRAITNDTWRPPFAARAFHDGARKMLPEDVVNTAYRNMGGRNDD